MAVPQTRIRATASQTETAEIAAVSGSLVSVVGSLQTMCGNARPSAAQGHANQMAGRAAAAFSEVQAVA
jgi:hypothetical protein